MEIEKAKGYIKILQSEQLTSQELNSVIEFFEKFVDDIEAYYHRSISWNVLDFENVAKEIEGTSWQDYYDESKFQDALHKMINKHEPEYGISCVEVEFYLDKMCLINEK